MHGVLPTRSLRIGLTTAPLQISSGIQGPVPLHTLCLEFALPSLFHADQRLTDWQTRIALLNACLGNLRAAPSASSAAFVGVPF